jgi:hypothetical protein
VTANISFYGGGSGTSRVIGEYRRRTAIAVVNRGADGWHHMNLRANKLVDLFDLRDEIRAGTIYPERSYEEVQVPPPARHLRQLFGEACAIIRRDVYARLHRA